METVYTDLRSMLLRLPEVRLGSRFGREAFFVGNRFFCHFHRGRTLSLDAFVWDKVTEVVNTIPGVVPHPQYGAFGWVRLDVYSPADESKAKNLIESSYLYCICIKRISLPKTPRTRRMVERATRYFPNIGFKTKPSSKRIQVVMEVRNFTEASEARLRLNEAADYLRRP